MVSGKMGRKERITLGLESFAAVAFITLGALGRLSDGIAIALLGFMSTNLAIFSGADAMITRAFAGKANGGKS